MEECRPCHYRRHHRQSELHLPVSEAQYSLPGRLWSENPETGIRYTRAELDAEDFSGKIEAYSCKEHVYEKGYCKYCNALIADCKHADLDRTTGVCGNCGIQVLAAVRSEEGNVYCTSWETLCSETEKLVDGKEYTVYFTRM